MKARILCGAAMTVAVLVSATSMAAIVPITSVETVSDGSPPYLVQSVTVGDYSVSAKLLATGTSVGEALAGTSIRNADNLDLNSIASRHHTPEPWQITMLGGYETWRDSNGNNPDFFLFEAGMNDGFIVQAILADGTLGQEVNVAASNWGGTGLRREGIYNFHHPIGGVAFAVTDLLDAHGRPLTLDTAIKGIQINSTALDPASFSVVVPEPFTFALLGLGGLLLTRRHRLSGRFAATGHRDGASLSHRT